VSRRPGPAPSFPPSPAGSPGGADDAASAAPSPWVPALGTVRIGPLRRRHLRTVLRIDGQQPQRGWSLGLYLAELKRVGDRRYIVAQVDGAVTGFAGILFQRPEAHVTTIAVDQSRRGLRVGTRLMLVLARQAIAAGCESLTLEVRAGNRPALALYRRFGLAPAGIRPGYYADIGEDALIMWAHDLATPAYAERLAGIEARLHPPTTLEGLDR
jgi:ribosomal-protein-alanine N-acetyltransferase